MLTRIRRRAAVVTYGDEGISLSELVVVMALFTVVGAMATMFLTSSNKANNATLQRGFNSATARQTLDAWTNLLRVADSPIDATSNRGRFTKITPTEIQFYASIDNRDATGRATPTKVDLALVGSELVETRYDGTTGALISTRHLGSGAAASNAWLFTPYSGSTALPLTTADCVSGSTPVTGYCGAFANDGSGTVDGEVQLETVNRVDIAFTVTDSASLAPTAFAASVSVIRHASGS